MKIYQFELDANNNNILLLISDKGYNNLKKFNGSSYLKDWKPLELYFYKEEKIYNTDVYSFNGIPVFEEQKLFKLKPMLLKYGELLPVKCENRILYLYNVTTVIDALDVEKSDCMKILNNIILKVNKPVFKTELLTNIDIFKVKQANLFTIYVSENFVKLAKENNITGLLFKDFS